MREPTSIRRGRVPLLWLLAAVLLASPARATQGTRAVENQVTEQGSIGLSVPAESAEILSPGAPGQAATLRTLRSDAKLLVVHLWATWCQPCKEEFVHLKKLFPDGWYREAQLVLVASQDQSSAVSSFLQTYAASLPQAPHYVDEGGVLQKAVKLTKLPVTLLVDRQFVVRQAFDGPITARRGELMSSIDHYLSPPSLTSTGGTFLQCRSPPCIEPSFFLHRSLLLSRTSRWVPRRRVLEPALVELPVAAKPNLIYLFSPSCTRCEGDLAALQRVAHGWSRTRGASSFVGLMASADPGGAASLLERQEDPANLLLLHSSMPQLVELVEAEGAAVTLIMNRQGYIRNAFVGPFTQYRREATDALQAAQKR